MLLLLPQKQPNAIQLHYWFNDGSHNMDAHVQNKCEYEFLGILKEIAKTFEADVIVETEPIGFGGLRRIFKIIFKNEQKKGVIITSVVIALTTTIFINPIATAIGEITKLLIEKVFEDSEMKSLEKEKLKEEIENLKIDTEFKRQKLNQNNVIIKRRSNFYEELGKYQKVDKVSFLIQDNFNQPVTEETFINRINFKEFVLVSDDLEPDKIEDAIIEIISPVLKKENYKWRGIYKGDTISFNMKSNEFKTLVQTGKVEFKNGSSINCLIEIKRRINNEGIIEITDYNIVRVNSYFENNNTVETSEGNQHRKKVEADKNQMKLFNSENNDQ